MSSADLNWIRDLLISCQKQYHCTEISFSTLNYLDITQIIVETRFHKGPSGHTYTILCMYTVFSGRSTVLYTYINMCVYIIFSGRSTVYVSVSTFVIAPLSYLIILCFDCHFFQLISALTKKTNKSKRIFCQFNFLNKIILYIKI